MNPEEGARGADRSRTGDGGFADLCLTTWLRRRVPEKVMAPGGSAKSRSRLQLIASVPAAALYWTA